MGRAWTSKRGTSRQRSEIIESILRIARGLVETASVTGPRRPPAASIDFADGSAGTATFFAYLAQASAVIPEFGNSERWVALAEEHLLHALKGISEYPMESGLFSGLSGSAWAIAHVGDLVAQLNSAIDSKFRRDQVRFLGEIDEVLIHFVEDPASEVDFDLVSGLVGIGAYALEVSSRPPGERLLMAVLSRLADLAVWNEQGCAWPTVSRAARDANEGTAEYFDMGVAHGQAGVLSFLASAVSVPAVLESPISKDVHRYLEGSGSWLLAHSLASGGHGGFPWAVLPSEKSPGPVRAAWCYGDPGVATAISRAGIARKDSSWTSIALDLMVDCARRDETQCRVKDACLCHGSAGLLHMFNRFSQTYGCQELHEGLLRWLHWTLEFQSKASDQNIAGYSAFNVEEGIEFWEAERGFLNGVAGIGLAMLATIDEAEPAWDRFLLLS